MGERREWWRRTPNVDSAPGDKPADKKVPEFRSDNDLLEWRFVAPFAFALTFFSLCLFGAAHLPFVYSPVATVPAIILILIFRWRSIRDRKAGKRFSLYDPDDT
jgi:hypothetical protein